MSGVAVFKNPAFALLGVYILAPEGEGCITLALLSGLLLRLHLLRSDDAMLLARLAVDVVRESCGLYGEE